MRLTRTAPILVAGLLAATTVRADEPKPQWLPGMPVPQGQPKVKEAAEPTRVVSPEGTFALLAPGGFSVEPSLPDPKEFVDRVLLKKDAGGGTLRIIAEDRMTRLDPAGEAFRRHATEVLTGYATESRKALTDSIVGEAASATLAGHPAWQVRIEGQNKKKAAIREYVAVGSDGRRRFELRFFGPSSEATDASWADLLGGVEYLTASYAAQTFKDDLGEFVVVPPAGWLRTDPPGAPPPTRESRSYVFPARDGSGASLQIEVVPLPAGGEKATVTQLVSSYRTNLIDGRRGTDAKEVARARSAVREGGAGGVEYAIWTYKSAKGVAEYLLAGGVIAGGRIFSLYTTGPAALLPEHRPLIEESLATFQLATK